MAFVYRFDCILIIKLNMPKTRCGSSEENTISIKLITENFEYDLISSDRPKTTAVFHIHRSIIYKLEFSLAIPKCRKKCPEKYNLPRKAPTVELRIM